MKKYIFWKLEEGKKITVKTTEGTLLSKEEIKKQYPDLKYQGVDSVNC